MLAIYLQEESFYDLKYIASGVFFPLDGFMCYEEYRSVVENMQLLNGDVWTIPITLEIDDLSCCEIGESVDLVYDSKKIGNIKVADKFQITDAEILRVFGTFDDKHPGVKKEKERSPYRVGGKITLNEEILKNTLYKGYIKEIFRRENPNITTIAGFQTRNPIHRAHEHLQRVALEICDLSNFK